jgi:hypothetical protein
MRSGVLRLALILTLTPSLMAFRMPLEDGVRDKLLYDVRGAFVTARPDVPQGLVIATDMLIDEAVRLTMRSSMLPRTIISVRIDRAAPVPVVFGRRLEARVTVQAVSVSTGEPVATGSFETSVFFFGDKDADAALARKIADRVASEFRLRSGHSATITSALFEP